MAGQADPIDPITYLMTIVFMDPLTIAQLVCWSRVPLRAARVSWRESCVRAKCRSCRARGRLFLIGQRLPAYRRTREDRVEVTPEAPEGESA
jgi:hypothetical protein